MKIDKIIPKDFSPIATTIILGLVLILIFFPYIQTEINDNFYAQQLNQIKLCKTDKNPDFKQMKLIYLEKFRSSAKVYCLYDNQEKNISMTLYFSGENWNVEYSRLLSEGFYWPIYY
jgi:hypothetical protein